jgi:hypothetical protein
MIRRFALLLLLLAPFVMTGCSDGNSSAPPSTQAHPFDWYTAHRPAATASPEFVDCTGCHGADLMGSGGAPSCFSASFGGRSCHAGGPVPHPMDGTFLSGAAHGPEAKADLTFCQICHSDNPTGGAGSNPRFNVGIDSQGSTGCEACHGVNYAHPAAWAGPNSTFHYSAGNIQNACTLCHGASLDGVGGVGVSCLGCHDSVSTFTLDCAACHGTPPGATETVDHGGVSAITSHDVCTVCHGMKETTTGGAFSAAANYALFEKATDTQGDHWDGNINMNSATGYNETNFGCDTALCHGNDAAHQLSDSGLPVVTADFGGANVPHAVDGSFLLPANHGPAVKAQTAAFPNGLLDCQPCHATAGTDNPRFNVGINSASGTGCESLACHPTNMAHPSNWYDVGAKHSDIAVADLSAMCVLCHVSAAGGPASPAVGPACVTCHPADPLANPTGCASCHNTPPDSGAVAGNVRPNRAGSHTLGVHSFWACAECHFGVGYNTVDHFDQSAPASVDINDTRNGLTLPATYDPVTGNCTNVSCHGGDGSVLGPW